jgi:hypothetical protein
MNEVMKQYLLKLVRYGAVAFGGWLVQRGFPEGGSPEFVDIVTGLMVAALPLVWSFFRTKFFVKKAQDQALLTHALATELIPAPTTPLADAIINKLVNDTAPAMPVTGTSTAKVDAALAGTKP